MSKHCLSKQLEADAFTGIHNRIISACYTRENRANPSTKVNIEIQTNLRGSRLELFSKNANFAM